MNGTFTFTDPVACSPIDNVSRSCSLQDDNVVGFYESSSWEYSWCVEPRPGPRHRLRYNATRIGSCRTTLRTSSSSWAGM